jgi:dihydrofolate reductase
MGRKTFQAIGRPLPGRPNIVITRDESFAADGVETAHSLGAAIDRARGLALESGADEICIVGGGEIYRQAIAMADILHVTHVEADVIGDTSFPAIDPAIWAAEGELDVPPGEKDTFPSHFVTYRRR